MGKTNKVFGIIGGIHFIFMGLLLCLMNLFSGLARRGGAIKLPVALLRPLMMLQSRDRNLSMILSYEGGIAAGIALLVIFTLIGVALLTRKRLLLIIGAGLGILVRLMAGLGVFDTSASMLPFLARMRMHLRFLTRVQFRWPLLLFGMLALTYFAALLLCGCVPKLARLFGWIGAGSALLAILPCCFYGAALLTMRIRFVFSGGIVVLAILLAAGAVFAGETMQKKKARPQPPQYRQVPPQYGQVPPQYRQ
ncbi:MAG: hypothetical protein K6C12_09560 [Oscillospiraceae bacterium]|nr:hypothetical protein [Oscillospiraceae bacterium]